MTPPTIFPQYTVMARMGDNAQARRARVMQNGWRGGDHVWACRKLTAERRNCERIGCTVRENHPSMPLGFVAERDGKFYASFEIVEALP